MLFDREPVLIAQLVRAAIVAATAFGLGLSPAQIGAVVLFTEAVLGVLVRRAVTSPATAAGLATNAPQASTPEIVTSPGGAGDAAR
jgi:hypothetical protein